MPEFESLSTLGFTRNLLRRDEVANPDHVTFVELFFDLVFVLAITQVLSLLNQSPNWEGLTQTVIVCMAIWWVWVYTTWATNWLDPETRPVLWLLLSLMVLGLVISQSIPDAFSEKGILFAGAYLVYSLVRTTFVIIATTKHRPAIAAGQKRILIWFVVSAPFWLIGAFQPVDIRIALWGAAIVIDYIGPAAYFWLPGRGRSSWESFQIRGAHFAERSALFIIIVLGESILVTGSAISGNLTSVSVFSFAAAFINSVLLWVLYFSRGERGGNRFITEAKTTGPVARISYTYLHVVLVLGIVLTTHANEVVLEAPLEVGNVATLGFLTAGPILYLLGNIAFKRSVGLPWPRSHFVGIGAFAVLLIVNAFDNLSINAICLAWIATGIIVIVVVLEDLAWRPSKVETHVGGKTLK